MKFISEESYYFKQRSAEWHEARMGILTASNFYEAVRYLKNGNRPANRFHLMKRMSLELISGDLQGTYVNDAMRHGTEMEEEVINHLILNEPGVVDNTSFKRVLTDSGYIGISPDLVMLHNGMRIGYEVKCPYTVSSFEKFNDGVPEIYLYQCLAYIVLLECDEVNLIACMRNGNDLTFIKHKLKKEEYKEEIKKMKNEIALFLKEFSDFNKEIRENCNVDVERAY